MANRFIHQPPSPPQSMKGETPADQIETVPVYHPELVHRPDMAYDPRTGVPYGCPSPYYSMPMQHPMLAHGLQINTPPPTDDLPGKLEPASPVWSSPGHQSPMKPRVAKATRARRRPNKVSDRKSKLKMDIPLSKATKHLSNIPLRDMEQWVNRPIEARRAEVAKRDGKVARPMNSFMLYRSAYAERAKAFFAETNHQLVSTAAGDSWKKESREIRAKYENLATVEKTNHLKAHPLYKFSPSKSEKDKRVRRTPDNKPDLVNHTPSSSPFLQTSEADSNDWASRDSTPFDIQDHGLPMGNYLGSSWQTSTPPSRSVPGMMWSPEHQYIQTINPSTMGSQVEDVRFKKMDLQDLQYASSSALAGLPGAAHRDLLQPQTSAPPSGNGQLDPQLLTYPTEEGHYPPPYMWQEAPAFLPSSVAPSAVSYPAGSYQPGMPDRGWESQETVDSNGEFDHWINHGSGY